MHSFGLLELHGNRDDIIDPGETWQMTPTVHNAACDITGRTCARSCA
jgi:hypothetical protein